MLSHDYDSKKSNHSTQAYLKFFVLFKFIAGMYLCLNVLNGFCKQLISSIYSSIRFMMIYEKRIQESIAILMKIITKTIQKNVGPTLKYY